MNLKTIISILIFTFSGFMPIFSQTVSYEKFLGVWSCDKDFSHPRSIKITESDGKVLVQMKIKGEIRRVQNATIKNSRLCWIFFDSREYGKWSIGTVRGEAENILSHHDDGTYGSDGQVTGYYDAYRYGKKTANVCNDFWEYQVEIKEGNLQLYARCMGDYCYGDTPLFYQSSNLVYVTDYTNW